MANVNVFLQTKKKTIDKQTDRQKDWAKTICPLSIDVWAQKLLQL